MMSENLSYTRNGNSITVNMPVSYFPTIGSRANGFINISRINDSVSIIPVEMTPDEIYENNLRALHEVQKAMEDVADEFTEEDIIRICKEIRSEGHYEDNA
jgi:hypothetical protein